VSKKRKIGAQVEESQLEVCGCSLHLIFFLLVRLKLEFMQSHIFLPNILYLEVCFNFQGIFIDGILLIFLGLVVIYAWNSEKLWSLLTFCMYFLLVECEVSRLLFMLAQEAIEEDIFETILEEI